MFPKAHWDAFEEGTITLVVYSRTRLAERREGGSLEKVTLLTGFLNSLALWKGTQRAFKCSLYSLTWSLSEVGSRGI